MGLFIGMDEAGYGPNLGPLVISVTVWEVPGEPRDFDLATALADVITASPSRNDRRLHINDSKQVYTPSRGLSSLERSVLSTLNSCGHFPSGFRELREVLTPPEYASGETEPWFEASDLSLPLHTHSPRLSTLTTDFSECCQEKGVRLKAIRSDVVLTQRFNNLTSKFGSKGLTLSRASMQLLRSVWNPDEDEPSFIVADKHGGRNRYDDLLAETFDDAPTIIRGVESTPRSEYRVGESEIVFQTKAEEHLPVALASMVSKYVREVAMMLFNRFWQSHQPGLKGTKGYPVDAKRFKAEIEATRSSLGIEDAMLWRER